MSIDKKHFFFFFFFFGGGGGGVTVFSKVWQPIPSVFIVLIDYR